MTTLIIKRQYTAVELYNGETVDPLLSEIEKEARSRVFDCETSKGQSEARSFAHKIAKTKTYLDSMGKDLGSEMKATLDAINAERKKVRDRMDALKAETLAPVLAAEKKEADRIAKHNDVLATISTNGDHAKNSPLSISVYRLDEMADVVTENFDRDWEEFDDDARIAYESAMESINAAKVARKQYDDDQAELKRLKDEAAKRDAEDERKRLIADRIEDLRECESNVLTLSVDEISARIERLEIRYKAYCFDEYQDTAEKVYENAHVGLHAIKRERIEESEKEKEAARLAKIEADKKADDERKANQERMEAETKRRIEEAEKEAAHRERERIKAEVERRKQEQASREADEKHKASVRKEVVEALVETGAVLARADAVKICLTIENNQIPHLSIKF